MHTLVHCGFRGKTREALRNAASLLAAGTLALTVGVAPASAASVYDTTVQSSLRNLATAVESYAMFEGSYKNLSESELSGWGWSNGTNETTVIHIMDSGNGWWASMQDVRGSSEYLYESAAYVGTATGSVFRAAHQPTAAATVPGVTILDSGSEIDAMAVGRRLEAAGIAPAALCEELVFVPGHHTAGSSATDEALTCNAMVAAGTVTTTDVIRMLMQMGAFATIEAVAIDLVGDGSGLASIPDHIKSWFDKIPKSLPTDIWNTTKVVEHLTSAATDAAAVEEIKDECFRKVGGYEEATGNNITLLGACSTWHVFIAGNDDKANEASEHDADAIASHVAWTVLTRGNNGSPSGWYSQMPECTVNRQSGQDCDEFPFRSTSQGGANANPPVSLRLIDYGANRSQGAILTQFYSKCSVEDGGSFLVLALPRSSFPDVDIPTEGICSVD